MLHNTSDAFPSVQSPSKSLQVSILAISLVTPQQNRPRPNLRFPVSPLVAACQRCERTWQTFTNRPRADFKSDRCDECAGEGLVIRDVRAALI